MPPQVMIGGHNGNVRIVTRHLVLGDVAICGQHNPPAVGSSPVIPFPSEQVPLPHWFRCPDRYELFLVWHSVRYSRQNIRQTDRT